MAFKLLHSVITTCTIGTCKSHTFLRCLLPIKRQYCSKKDLDDLPEKRNVEDSDDVLEKRTVEDLDDLSEKPNVEDLLKSSSPLRSSNVEDFWATSPYPKGTVFREFEIEDKEKNEDASSKSVIVFPGQGNQFVGMAKNLMKYPVALDMFKTANDILGYDLLKICLEGPECVLNETRYCQPATFVCSLALLEKLKDERPWAISNCVATCGYSLGELTALVFAGVINYEIGLNLVKIRAEAMDMCCKKTPGGMLTILTGPRTTLSAALSDAVEHCKTLGIEQPCCTIASYLFPSCKVIAGNREALEFIKNNAKNYGIRRHSELPVSGAFHTSLMKDAEEPFQEKLSKIQMSTPIVRVFSNVTAKPYKDSHHILKVLPKQISSPVKWEQTMHTVLSPKNSLPPYVYECGPGTSLTAVAVKINNKVSSTSFSIQL